jgi:hypothetical protein
MIAIGVSGVLFAFPFKGTAQLPTYITLNSTTNANGINYAIQTNQVVSVVGYDWSVKPNLYANLADGTLVDITPVSSFVQTSSVSSAIPQMLTGLTNIIVKPIAVQLGYNPGWATFQVTTPGFTTTTSNYVPADAVVIPASETGNVQIILESSADLVNWVASSPGFYSAASATNRFFRVRAVSN